MATSVPRSVAAAKDLERYELRDADLRVETDVSAGKAYTLSFPSGRGTMTISASVPESSSLSLDVDMASATSSWQVVADVAKERFLHTDQYPRATILSRSLARGPHGLEVWIDFTLHGTKRTIIVPASVELSACRARFSFEFSFNRHDFGIVDSGSLESFVSDTAVVRTTVDVARKSAPASCSAAKRSATKIEP